MRRINPWIALPWAALLGVWTACGSESANEGGDAGSCPTNQVLIYPLAGCDGTVKPICAGPSFDACLNYVCACDGTTISGCGDWRKPWTTRGHCPNEGGTEAGP